MSSLDNELLDVIPEDVLEEIKEYEEKFLRPRVRGAKKKFPSNEDVAEAIKIVSGGTITRANIENLYEAVKKYLEEQGFDTTFLSESRFWRLVTSLARKGAIKLRI